MNTPSVPKISVIVPVYKAEKYLHKCVDSLLAQTFHDFEVILVDDGSPDHSGRICDAYATKDSRVRVIHQANGGVSSARQKGIDEARGTYTIHADPDDWVEPEMLEELYRKAEADNADMVICDFYSNAASRQTYHTQRPSALEAPTVLRDLFQQLHGSCCNKLVRRACYRELDVCFPQGMSLWEDLYFNASLLLHPIRVSYLPRAFYHYVQDQNVNTLSRNQGREQVLVFHTMHGYLDRLLLGTEVEGLYKTRKLWDVFGLLYMGSCSRRDLYEYFGYMAGYPYRDFPSWCAHLALRCYLLGVACIQLRKGLARLKRLLRRS